MDHYLWCTRCDIIKPKISHPGGEQLEDKVWICRSCRNEVSEISVPRGTDLLTLPLDLFKLLAKAQKERIGNDTQITTPRKLGRKKKAHS